MDRRQVTLVPSDVGRRAMRLLLTTVEQTAAGAAWLVDDDEARAAWLGLRNKVEAFRAFEHVDALLDARVDEHAIADLIQRAGRVPPPRSVWAAEGIGYHATAARCRRGGDPRDLLASVLGVIDPSCRTTQSHHTPPLRWALIPLHAGLGAALAAYVLESVRGEPTPSRMREALARLRGLCEANAEPAHLDVTLEALGFAARSLFAEMVPAIVEGLRVASPRMLPLVWHGVGRAIYFAPSASIPVAETRRRVLDEVMSTAPAADSARANTIAGFAWAVTLVNLRDPIAIEPFAADAVRLGIERPFARGIHDALEAWRRCAPDDPAATAFASHQPRNAHRRAAHHRDTWARVMRAAAPRYPRQAGDLFQIAEDVAERGWGERGGDRA